MLTTAVEGEIVRSAGGRLIQAADSVTGTIARGYDGLDRLISETTPQGSVSYGYDSAGRRTSMTVSGQAPVNYSYDNDSRLVQIAQGASTVSFAYDNNGRRTTLTLPNGVTMSYGYDAASQLTGINYSLGVTELGNLAYSYDLAGRRTLVGGTFARTGLPAALASASYNVSNQLTQFGPSGLSYDANGNLTSDGANSYTWNTRNQLVSISGGASASFQYDAFGRRVSKTVGAISIGYLYDGVNPVEELSGGAASAAMLTGSVDEYFHRTDSSGTFTYLTDALGSTIALAGTAGALGTQYTYEPFGNTTTTGTGSSNSFQFTGRENDATGLYFYRARYYSPTFQRFISEDPIGFSGAHTNFYGYGEGNPITYSDPSGLCIDPGGPGVRYCIDRFIPTNVAWPFPFNGDNRGPNSNGGSYRTRQLIFPNGNDLAGPCLMGSSTIIGHLLPMSGWSGTSSVAGRKDGSLEATCEGNVGSFFDAGPNIQSTVEIAPDGTVTVSGTFYPSMEVWRYQDGQQPELLFYYDAPHNPFLLLMSGPFEILDLFY